MKSGCALTFERSWPATRKMSTNFANTGARWNDKRTVTFKLLISTLDLSVQPLDWSELANKSTVNS